LSGSSADYSHARTSILIPILFIPGIEEVPVKSVVNRVGHQLKKALSEKGMALLVNHGISDEKVRQLVIYKH